MNLFFLSPVSRGAGLLMALLFLVCGMASDADARPGDFDYSFGNGTGRILRPSSDFNNLPAHATGINLQADGKLVLTGYVSDVANPMDPYDYYISRYNADGSPDTTFGTSGNGIILLNPPVSNNTFFDRAAIDANGRIIVKLPVFDTTNFRLYAFTPGGLPDMSFGNGAGFADIPQTDASGNTYFFNGKGTPVADAANRIYIALTTNQNGTPDAAVMRFLPSGAIDLSYGVNGFAVNNQVGSQSIVTGVPFVTPAGDLTVSTGGNGEIGVARFLASGLPDAAFGTGGFASLPVTGFASPAAGLALLADGSVVTATGSFIVRFSAAGVIDNAFGTGGKRDFGTAAGYGSCSIKRIQTASTGKIYAVGTCGTGTAADVAILALNADGTNDVTFGRNAVAGWHTTDVSTARDEGYDAIVKGTLLYTAISSNKSGDSSSVETIIDTNLEPRYYVGNRVWYDTDYNTYLNNGESGIGNVLLRLYTEADVNFSNPLAETRTDANGYYDFRELPAGRYVIRVEAVNFQSGGPLLGLISSSRWWDANNDIDNDDNGIDNGQYATLGSPSRVFILGPVGTEPVNEVDTALSQRLLPNDETNLTVDFGFHRLSPTAANATVSGRVELPSTAARDRLTVFLTDTSSGLSYYGQVNRRGYFVIGDIPTGNAYVLTVMSKRFTFEPQILNVNGDITDLFLVPTP